MKRILFITLLAIAAFALPGLSGALAQTRSPRANSVEDFFNRGVARYQQGDLEGALRDFDRAIEIASTISPGVIGQRRALQPRTSALIWSELTKAPQNTAKHFMRMSITEVDPWVWPNCPSAADNKCGSSNKPCFVGFNARQWNVCDTTLSGTLCPR